VERQEDVTKKTVLLIDDEQGYLEALADALEFEGYNVLKATTAENALRILENNKIDLVTIDIMLPPGQSLEKDVESHQTGIFLCEQIRKKYPEIDAFAISVISNVSEIRKIESLGVRFLRKGETPLRTVLNMIRSRLEGIPYSTHLDKRGMN
jgi:two-component system nitrogen regulation response regulator NtrX